MAIQINQQFPHCARCGIMLHSTQKQIDAVALDGKEIVFCSQRCFDEYRERWGFSSASNGSAVAADAPERSSAK